VADDAGSWASLVQWVLSNPEKGALFLVIAAGAWRWLRELRGEAKTEDSKESFMDILLRENKELRAELRRYRRRPGQEDENSERPS